jgi:Holliday junction resolvasome RuvABC ATP-dependent DNA helicase subunit
MTEEVFDILKKLKRKYGLDTLQNTYQFLLSGLGKPEIKTLKEMVNHEKGEETLHPTLAAVLWKPQDAKSAKIYENLGKKGYLQRTDDGRFSLTEKAFTLFS